MAGGAGAAVAHLQAGGAGGVGQLGGLGLGREIQGLGGLLRETQRGQRVRHQRHPHRRTEGPYSDRGQEDASMPGTDNRSDGKKKSKKKMSKQVNVAVLSPGITQVGKKALGGRGFRTRSPNMAP